MAINSALAGAMAGQTSASLGKPVQQTDSTLKQALSSTNQRMSLTNPFKTAVGAANPMLPILGNAASGFKNVFGTKVSANPSTVIQNADKANLAFESLIPKRSAQPSQILPKPPQNNQSFSPNYASQNNSSGYYNTDFGYSNYNPNTSGNTTFNNFSTNNSPGQQQNGTDNKPAPASNPYADQLAALKSKIEELSTSVAKSGAPTDAEVQAMNDLDAAQSRLRNINASEQLGLSGIEQKPIALEFQTGQKAALQKQAAALAQAAGAEGETLAQKLARLQAQRTSNLDVNKTLLSNAQNEFTNLQTQAKPVEVNQGNSLVRFNPSTGQYETVVEGGNKQTDDIRNYEYAKQNGYQGSLLDFQREKVGMSSGAYDIQSDPTTGQFYRINKLTGQTEPISGVGGLGQFQVGVKPTDAQSAAFGYANRAGASNDIINQLGSVGSEYRGVISGSRVFPNILKTSERQQLEQAQRDFVNAVLRRESGAAISPEEFNNAAQQYFPQPGDSEAVMAQKTANRQRTIQNLNRESGPAARQNTQVAMNNQQSNSQFGW